MPNAECIGLGQTAKMCWKAAFGLNQDLSVMAFVLYCYGIITMFYAYFSMFSSFLLHHTNNGD